MLWSRCTPISSSAIRRRHKPQNLDARRRAAGRLPCQNSPTTTVTPRAEQAEIAFRQGRSQALARDPDVPRRGQIAWLRRQRPVAIDGHNCVLLAYPSEVEARLA